MDLGRNYKDIYKSVNEDLVVFGNSLKIGLDTTSVETKEII